MATKFSFQLHFSTSPETNQKISIFCLQTLCEKYSFVRKTLQNQTKFRWRIGFGK